MTSLAFLVNPTDHQIVTVLTDDYVGETYTAVPNLVQIRPRGASVKTG